MTQDAYQRKLCAILSADVKGYSQMMGTDEEATVRTITDYRQVFADSVREHRGRIVDTPGDNILAEFESVVNALKCALSIQEDIKNKNAALSENRRMEFRIGINLGDVIQESGRIYGDGVNIAARIEGLAEPGGICISRSAYEQVKKKLDIGYEYLGEHSVKNISEPVSVYRVLTDPDAAGKVIGEKRTSGAAYRKGALVAAAVFLLAAGGFATWFFASTPSRRTAPAAIRDLAFPLPEKPSVAVLPFKDLTGDPAQQYKVSGTTDAVRIALARVPNLFVIDHNSTSIYADKDIKTKQVAEDLGVRYVIEGSVQRSGDTIRINAQLVDALTGRFNWADRYDRKEDDLFALQDEIGQKIATELEVQLTEGEQARIWHRQTDNLQAYRKFRIGKEHYRKRTKQDNIAARKNYQQAIALDPGFAEAKCHLGFTYIQEALRGWTKNRRESFAQARSLAEEAIKLDPSYPHSYTLLGSIYLWQGEREKALELITHSVELEPNYAGNIAMKALTLVYMERPEEALEEVEAAMRLNPYYPDWYLGVLGRVYLLQNQYSQAIDAFESRRKRSKSTLNMVELTIAHELAGNRGDAKALADKMLKKKPKFALKYLAWFFQYERPETTERFLTAAQAAGIPR